MRTKHLSVTILTLLGITTAGLALSCTIGFGSAQAANIQAFENGDVVSLTGTQFDLSPFISSVTGESARGNGIFTANSTATGNALLVLTEGPGGPFSDWLLVTYPRRGPNPKNCCDLELGCRSRWGSRHCQTS
jgi:hypothetical protein